MYGNPPVFPEPGGDQENVPAPAKQECGDGDVIVDKAKGKKVGERIEMR